MFLSAQWQGLIGSKKIGTTISGGLCLESVFISLKLIQCNMFMTVQKVASVSLLQHVLQCTCCICSVIMFCRLSADWEWRVLVARRLAHIYTQRHTSASPPTLQPCLHLVPFITKDDARIVAYGMCVLVCPSLWGLIWVFDHEAEDIFGERERPGPHLTTEVQKDGREFKLSLGIRFRSRLGF